MATVKSKLADFKFLNYPSLFTENHPTSSNFSQKPLKRVNERSRSTKKRFNEFYQQQLNYQDAKNSKIQSQLHEKDRLIEDLKKQRNRFSLLSSGSRRILNRTIKKPFSEENLLLHYTQNVDNNTSMKHFTKNSLDFRSPGSQDSTSLLSVHDRLFNDS